QLRRLRGAASCRFHHVVTSRESSACSGERTSRTGKRGEGGGPPGGNAPGRRVHRLAVTSRCRALCARTFAGAGQSNRNVSPMKTSRGRPTEPCHSCCDTV